MKSQEFVHIRKVILKLTQKGLGDNVGISYRTIQDYESGKSPIPKPIALLMQMKAEQVILPPVKSTVMDVTNVKELSIQQMLDFCFQHEEEFLNHPLMKLLIKNHRLEAVAEAKEELIFKNFKSEND